MICGENGIRRNTGCFPASSEGQTSSAADLLVLKISFSAADLNKNPQAFLR